MQSFLNESKFRHAIEEYQLTDEQLRYTASSIQYVASKGLMNGTSKDKFEPNVTMTRVMFVQTLFKAEKVQFETNPQGKISSFKDVIKVSWHEEGVTSGLGNHL